MTGNYLGPKTWIAKVVSSQSKVVLKLWDAWRFDSAPRNQEASIYLHLRSLWGKVIPALGVSSPIEFFHGLILEYLDMSILSRRILNICRLLRFQHPI